jgi:hypothetical protein
VSLSGPGLAVVRFKDPLNVAELGFRWVTALATNNTPKSATFLIVPVPAAHVMSVLVVASMNLN